MAHLLFGFGHEWSLEGHVACAVCKTIVLLWFLFVMAISNTTSEGRIEYISFRGC